LPVAQDASVSHGAAKSQDALIITIGIKLQGLNQDKTLQQCDVLTGLVLTISTAPFDARQALSQYRPSVR
jgi:hypothetical protein